VKRRILIVALAVVLAVFGTASVLAYVRQADTRAVAGMKAVTVLVATGRIPQGTSAAAAWQDGLLRTERLPASSVPADAVRSVSAGLGPLVVSSAVQPGQLLLRPMLVAGAEVTGGLPIPNGMVAVTVQLCLPEAVAGYVRAGSQVAVFDTYSPPSRNGNNVSAQPNCQGPHTQQGGGTAHTRMVLPSAQVLAATPAGGAQGGRAGFGQVSSGGSGQNNWLVTFAVRQSDAERLILLTETGLPYLALLTGASGTTPDATLVPLLRPLGR
jgi:pilus assembly protein CpaB